MGGESSGDSSSSFHTHTHRGGGGKGIERPRPQEEEEEESAAAAARKSIFSPLSFFLSLAKWESEVGVAPGILKSSFFLPRPYAVVHQSRDLSPDGFGR